MAGTEKETVVEKKYSPSTFGSLKNLSSIQIFVLEKRHSGEEHTEKEWEKIYTKDGF